MFGEFIDRRPLASLTKRLVMQTIFVNPLDTTHSIMVGIEPQGQSLQDSILDVERCI